MDEDEVEETENKAASGQWQWIIFWSMVINGIGNLVQSFAGMWHDIAVAMVAHGNWVSEQREFQKRAALEIEALAGEATAAEPAPAVKE